MLNAFKAGLDCACNGWKTLFEAGIGGGAIEKAADDAGGGGMALCMLLIVESEGVEVVLAFPQGLDCAEAVGVAHVFDACWS